MIQPYSAKYDNHRLIILYDMIFDKSHNCFTVKYYNTKIMVCQVSKTIIERNKKNYEIYERRIFDKQNY